MSIPSVISSHFDQVVSLCKKYSVDRLYVFGSAVSENFQFNSSDLDLIVELEPMPPLQKGEHLLALWNELETLFNREVDLLTDKPIRNPYFRKSVEATKQLIYEREGQEISH
jgi:hypothetical protein